MTPMFIENINETVEQIMHSGGMKDWLSSLICLFVIFIICVIADLITKKILLTSIRKIAKKSKTKWDDYLLDSRFFHRLSHLVPAVIMYFTIGIALGNYEWLHQTALKLINVYMIFVGAIVFSALLNSLHSIYQTFPYAKNVSIHSYLQLARIFIYSIAGILVLSILFEKSPVAFLTGMGAMAAVLMLVFKDTILGFVASIQLSANQMVHIGDWISMPSRGADGDVFEITLNTVKVRNFDKTISTIPTYALVTESFVNWRGMVESGGRRIMRSIYLDMKSIQFCSQEMLERYKKIGLVSEHLEKKTEEIDADRAEQNLAPNDLLNGRRMTNLGVFRKYCEEYIDKHPKTYGRDSQFIVMIRHLQPTEKGLPLEIYCFTNDNNWIAYEGIQADIFDHLLAMVPAFDLKVFQYPSSYDFSNFIGQTTKD